MKRRFNKFIMITLLIACVAAISSGCGGNESNAVNKEEDAKIKAIALNELKDGAYIQTKDKAIIPFMSYGKAYQDNDVTTNTMGNKYRIIWFANQDGLIPEITDEDCFIIKTSTSLPTVPTLYALEDYGFTIGCTLYKDTSSNLYGLSTDENLALCTGSTFNKNYLEANNNKDTRLFDIGGQKINESNVSTIGTITGLEKGKEFPIGLYNGTKYSEIKALVDTHVFVNSFQKLIPASDFQFTKDGYVIVKIPDDLTSGYYYFDEAGMFKYTKTAQ